MASDVNTTDQPQKDELWFELQRIPSIKRKVELVLKEYLECSKDDIMRELEDFGISRKQVTNALRDLKKEALVVSRSRGWYRYEGTTRVVENQDGEPAKNSQDLFKWFTIAILFHNIKGVLNGVDVWSSKWGNEKNQLQSSKERELKHHNGSVVLIRNYSVVQFVFKSTRPGLSRAGLMDAISTLYQMLMDLSLNGDSEIKYLEARNARKIMIPELVGKTFQLELVAGLVAKAYQDEDELQTEMVASGLSYSLADLINCANEMRSTTQSMQVQNKISAGVETTKSMMQSLIKLQVNHMDQTESTLDRFSGAAGFAAGENLMYFMHPFFISQMVYLYYS